jgi:hypothetical protein
MARVVAGAGHDDEPGEVEPPDEESGGTGGGESAGATAAPRRFDFERGLMAAAVVLLVAAAALLYLGRPSAAFVLAALGISAWLRDVRNGLRRKHDLVKRAGRNWEPRGRDDD